MRFVDRDLELERLQQQLALFGSGNWDNTCHLALLGLRRTGKTFLLKHFLDHFVNRRQFEVVYLDISKVANSPRDFARSLVLACLQAATGARGVELMPLALQTGNSDLAVAVDQFQRITLATGDNLALFGAAFTVLKNLPERKWVVALDEFQDILALERFRGIHSVDALFRAELQELHNVFFLISGSFPTIMERWLSDEKQYLFSHFSIIHIGEMTRCASDMLVVSRLGDCPTEVKRQFYVHSCGNPYLLSVLAREYCLREREVSEIFRDQVFDSGGVIYNYYTYLLDESLKAARGAGVLKETLKAMSLADSSLTAPDISRELGRSLEEVHAALKELIRIDLVYCDERRYHFRILPFRFFLRYRYLGLEQYEYERNDYLRSQVGRLLEAYNRAATELGRAKEFEIYYHVANAQGKALWGMRIPHFKYIEKNVAEDGSELDLVAVTRRGRRWVFEVKWRNKACGAKEIRGLLKKTVADQYVIVSRSGFTEDAKAEFGTVANVAIVDMTTVE
jgi:hypothetical protein